MKLIRGLQNIDADFKPSVVTIGNFDGVHLGHQQLIAKTKAMSDKYSCPSVLMTFEPLTHERFASEKLPRLMQFREKWRVLKQFDLDYILYVHFNHLLASLSPRDFVKKILVDRLRIKAVIVGDDFHFGAKRQGDFTLLSGLGKQYGFEAIQIATWYKEGARVSSSKVRQALQEGDLEFTRQLLGRNYSLIGKVIAGDQRGRSLGFPTANINLHRRIVPLSGVFVVCTHDLNAQTVYGVANIGIRPTFNGTRVVLEIHFFNFNQDIYGQVIQIEFLKKLREEKRFERFEDLIKQIHEDIQQAKDAIAQRSF